jgi:hypothetical protein
LNFQTLANDGCFARRSRPAGALFSFDFFSLPPLFSLIPPDLSSSPLFIYLVFFFSATQRFFFSAFFFSCLFFSPAFFLLSHTRSFFSSQLFFSNLFFLPSFFSSQPHASIFLLSFFFLLFFFFSSTLTLPHCCRRYLLSPEIQTRDPTPPELQARRSVPPFTAELADPRHRPRQRPITGDVSGFTFPVFVSDF